MATSLQKKLVSDHAIVRYLQRVKGVDIERIQAIIASDAVLEAVAFSHGAVVQIKRPDLGTGVYVVANENKIVTVKGG